MRKFLTVIALTALLLAIPFVVSVKAQTAEPPSEPPYSIVLMGVGSAGDGFSEWSGGFMFGGEYPVAGNGAVTLRFVYSQFNWNPDAPIRVLEPAGLLKFDIGKRWDGWIVGGVDAYIHGQNEGSALLYGVGTSRKVLTFSEDDGKPGYFAFAGEFTVVGAGGRKTGSYWQLKTGIIFKPPL